MWRAIVLAAGISLCILGGEFMVVDRMVLAEPGRSQVAAYGVSSTLSTSSAQLGSRRRVFVPPEWAPWGFLSGGVLLILYGASLSPSSGE